MSRKFKNNVGANTRPLIGGKEYKAPPEPPNLAAKFMRENRGGIPDEDTPAMTLAGEPVSAETPAPAPVATTDTPPAEPIVPDAAAPPPSDAAAADSETPQATADDTPGGPIPGVQGASGDVPPELLRPAAAKEQPAAVAAPRNEYDPEEEIALLDGEPKWKRGSVVLGLQERAKQQEEISRLKPAVAERDQILKTLGVPDTKAAMGFLEPFVRAVHELPARGHLLDSVAAMDQATVNYISQLLEDWKQLPAEQRAAFGQVGPTVQPQTPTDPRYDQLARNQALLEESLLKGRAEREVTTILTEWPFLRQDRKAWEMIQAAATSMWNEDEAKGIPAMQRRGYAEAIAQNRYFLETMKQAQERRVMQHASAAVAQPVSQLGGPPPTSAILPATHPEPPVAARPPRTKEYRGPLDGAAAAYLADLGYKQ